MTNELDGMTIAILAADGVEQVEPADRFAVDGNITSSRRPDDLPAFCEAIVREFSAVRAS